MTRYPYRRSAPRPPDVVPLELARKVVAERDAAVDRFDRAQQQLDAARRRMIDLEEENQRLRQAVATLQLRSTSVAKPPPQRDEEAAGADRALVSQLTADLANVRRHRDDEIAAGVRREHARLIERIADIRDTLERARAMAPEHASPWIAGLDGTIAAIERTLSREGVELIGEPGDRFDPGLHEAIAVGDHPDGIADRVLSVQQVGLVYADGGLVRPARVTVSR
jgi:molecular chaperone GrpE